MIILRKLKEVIKKRNIKWIVRGIIGILLLGVFSILALYGGVYFELWDDIPSEKELSNLSHAEASQVFDKDSTLIGKFYITDRESIPFDDFPEELIQALIATEDVRFYKHNGVDRRSMFRVFFKTILMNQSESGGGSTITQQLAKNVFKRRNHPYMSIVINKIRENIIARRLEKVYSKEEILTLYLNTVPFSGNTYGIESAARKFYNISAKELSLPQAATLIGTLKANHTYNPRLFPERSLQRRNVVLSQMAKYNFITKAQAEELMTLGLDIEYTNYNTHVGRAAYFQEQVRREALNLLAKEENFKENGEPYNLFQDGLKVYTTLDIGMQTYAEKAMIEHMTQLQRSFEKEYIPNAPWDSDGKIVRFEMKKLPVYKELKLKGWTDEQIIDSLKKEKETELFQWGENEVKRISTLDSLSHVLKFLNTGMVSINPHSGAILAYIGGIDYGYFQYDHVVQSKRQVGSIFKPIVYAAALENGVRPCEYFPIKEITYTDQKDWTPRNSDKSIDSDLNYNMDAALSQSLNTVTVQILRATQTKNVIRQAKLLGIEEEIEDKPSIALGSSSIRMIEMAQAYSAFLNDGFPVKPYFINKIEDKNGKVIVSFEPERRKEKAFSENTRQTMVEMMRNVVNNGTASRLKTRYKLPNDIAGKTGTTQHNADGWFVGLLPDLVSIVWVGNDNNNIRFKSTSLGQGANSALPIFANMIKAMNTDQSYDYLTKAKFKAPSASVISSMDCPPTSRDGFFKRLFNKEKDEQEFEEKPKKERRIIRRKRKREPISRVEDKNFYKHNSTQTLKVNIS